MVATTTTPASVARDLKRTGFSLLLWGTRHRLLGGDAVRVSPTRMRSAVDAPVRTPCLRRRMLRSAPWRILGPSLGFPSAPPPSLHVAEPWKLPPPHFATPASPR